VELLTVATLISWDDFLHARPLPGGDVIQLIHQWKGVMLDFTWLHD
jgi:hypothetical protein